MENVSHGGATSARRTSKQGLHADRSAVADASSAYVAGEPTEGPVSWPVSKVRKETFLSKYCGLKEPGPADADGTWGGFVCPLEHGRLIWAFAWLALPGGIIAITHDKLVLACVSWAGWLSSILYWWWPTYSWRRNLDIILIQCCLWTHVYAAVGAEHMVAYFAITGAGVLAYAVSWLFLRRDETWAGAICHVLVHVCANAANWTLYMGATRPF